ncbi:MAG TPA: hypothetical protein DIC34_00220 [Treponema sp.]|nr:MAG: hypothetical protein A2Y36_07670 [Treponema sp. GWA1_62_8]OHE69489.1 MAG: hypothetical protein A2001_19950 [Treponema sp. GWC1_61_84]OHE72480.1 MAG: hypothetical protein A2413_14060 [Treponema sp. RIFOXYC1_FULL_61_9]HCM24972.1 hypothetical protein [Treponema sp.]
MLAEFPNLSQSGDGYRRLFTDDYFDLYIWYDGKDGEPTGFQLNYSVRDDPHSLTCSIGGSCTHTKIDEGEDAPGRFKGSPILVSDGAFEKDTVLERFRSASRTLDAGMRNIIIKAIGDYAQD